MAAQRAASIVSGGARAARGVTLLEMLLVVAIIAAASLLAAGTLTGGFAGIQLRSSAKEIAANLRYARAQALTKGQPQKFVIDPRAHTWRATEDRRGEIPGKLGIVFTGTRGLQARAGEGAILFFPDGASTGGRVQLQSGKAAWNVDVAWLTGEVTLKRAERLE
ncbi:type II secretion system protein GspH [Luteimonas gilva]|uniref:Type II secretion system protein H n=1 Tax=Luteimonas gilva TaxID=2572684 RepID=A0A4V5ZQF7_9GAMM|nr:GspH/FimT family pseudopilin [Luteimonas gilva]TKR31033.1 type II secretion system protein GspH [Luteimonas gilva]